MKSNIIVSCLCLLGVASGSYAVEAPETTTQVPAPTAVHYSHGLDIQGLAGVPSVDEQTRAQVAEEYRKDEEFNKNTNEFKSHDKVIVNEVLESVFKIMESKRGGTAKVRIAAQILRDLVNIHSSKNHQIGSFVRLTLLDNLRKVAKESSQALKNEKKIPVDVRQLERAISDLETEHFDEKVLKMLKDFYLDKNFQLNAVGARVGAALLVGVDLGLGAGKLVSATGKKYLVVCPSLQLMMGIGVKLTVEHLTGKISTNVDNVLAAGLLPQKTDYLYGHNVAVDPSQDEDGLHSKQYYLTGLTASSLSFMKITKLSPLPGRDYKQVRKNLGLVVVR